MDGRTHMTVLRRHESDNPIGGGVAEVEVGQSPTRGQGPRTAGKRGLRRVPPAGFEPATPGLGEQPDEYR